MLPSASPQMDVLHVVNTRTHLHFTLCLCSTLLLTLTSLSTSQGRRAPAPIQVTSSGLWKGLSIHSPSFKPGEN